MEIKEKNYHERHNHQIEKRLRSKDRRHNGFDTQAYRIPILQSDPSFAYSSINSYLSLRDTDCSRMDYDAEGKGAEREVPSIEFDRSRHGSASNRFSIPADCQSAVICGRPARLRGF